MEDQGSTKLSEDPVSAIENADPNRFARRSAQHRVDLGLNALKQVTDRGRARLNEIMTPEEYQEEIINESKRMGNEGVEDPFQHAVDNALIDRIPDGLDNYLADAIVDRNNASLDMKGAIQSLVDQGQIPQNVGDQMHSSIMGRINQDPRRVPVNPDKTLLERAMNNSSSSGTVRVKR